MMQYRYTVARTEQEAMEQVTNSFGSESFLVETHLEKLEEKIRQLRDIDKRFAQPIFQVRMEAVQIQKTARCLDGHTAMWHVGGACGRCGDID